MGLVREGGVGTSHTTSHVMSTEAVECVSMCVCVCVCVCVVQKWAISVISAEGDSPLMNIHDRKNDRA